MEPPDTEGTSPAHEGDGEADAAEAFEAILARIAESAQTGVLLTGESGSGKSRAARRLHELSPRASGPFVSLHIAGLAGSLLEAELFGHVEGAFTGAGAARPGHFRRAEGGTLTLEAIETLPMSLQVKLLRVLQERVVEPVGSSEAVPVDVRVIATASIDLAAAVQAGTFREDLFFRLAVVPLRVPPLRTYTRGPRLDGLCARALQQAAERSGVRVRALGPSAVARLREHPWPGNVRELENALERALVLVGDAPELLEEHFDFLGEALEGKASQLAHQALAHGVAFETLERALFETALAEERGNVAAAARRLGLTRKAFDYRRKRL